MENTINQMTIMIMPTGTYPFYVISHNQIVEWLPYVINILTNSMFEVLIRRWAIGVDLLFHVALNDVAC